MWTYLAILVSVIVLAVVFIRKFLLFKGVGKNKKSLDKGRGIAEEEDAEIIGGRKISKEDRATVSALCSKGEALIKAGKDDEAIKCFVQALAIHGAHSETLNKLAMLYLQKQMFSAAAALFKQLGELTQDAVHFSHLGLTLFQQSDFEGAKEAYQRAVDLDSSRPQRFISLAQVYRSLNQPYNAMVAVSKAVELENNNPDFLYLLADLQIETGAREEAKKNLNQLLELDPKNKEFKNLMKEIKKMETQEWN